MPGRRYTPAEYALHIVVEIFSNLLFKLVEHQFTHTYAAVFHFCQLETIDYRVQRFPNSGALPCEEFSEAWLQDGET